MYERIPMELKNENQWVCATDSSKVPMCAWSNLPASSTNPQTWSDFFTAQKAVEAKIYDHIGYVFNDTGIVGIDIDDGYDKDGLMSRLAADIIGRCRSYTERSKSGRGFHILLKGKLPFKGRNNRSGVEIYQQSRYFIMTGDVLLFDKIKERQEAIDQILDLYFPEVREQKESPDFFRRIYSPVWGPPDDGRIRLRPEYPKIPQGSRNICLTSLAGIMHSQGYSKKHIYDELLYCNLRACDPPLDKRELKSICSSVTRYQR